LIDNGNPAPNAYNPDQKDSIPSYLIMQRQSKSKTGDVVRTVGPAHYNPKWPNEYHPGQQGISFGTAVRKDEDTTIKHNPAPNAYNLLGDFDFKDST